MPKRYLAHFDIFNFILGLSIFILLIPLTLTATPKTSFRVLIDPGHGGSDLGAVRDRFVESQIVLMIAEKLKTKLVEKNIHDVTLTRQNDSLVTLPERVAMAHQMKADLFISLHANTSNYSQLTGMEFYFNPPKLKAQKTQQKKWLSQNSEVIAQIQKDFAEAAKTEQSLLLSKTLQYEVPQENFKSVIKQAPFYVIENTKMPSVLIEVGFLSNRREAKKLSDPAYQAEIAERLAAAIIEYKEKSDKGSSVYEN